MVPRVSPAAVTIDALKLPKLRHPSAAVAHSQDAGPSGGDRAAQQAREWALKRQEQIQRANQLREERRKQQQQQQLQEQAEVLLRLEAQGGREGGSSAGSPSNDVCLHSKTIRGRTVRCACAVRKVGYFRPVSSDGQGDRNHHSVPIHRTARILTQSKNPQTASLFIPPDRFWPSGLPR